MFIESWIVPVSLGSTLNLQEARSVNNSMTRSKIEFIAYIYILL